MVSAITKADAMESVLLQGDLSKLNPNERTNYYLRVCESLGLNPLTKPFEYLSLNGKTVLYARRDCTEQLRKRDSVSAKIVSREVVEGVYVVAAQATLPDGRTDESIGAVPIDGLKGEARANAMMKAETKAKRRVTLSICGLGMLDETETETIPGAVRIAEADPEPPKELPERMQGATIKQPTGPDYSLRLKEAKSLIELAAAWNSIPTQHQRALEGLKNTLKAAFMQQPDEAPEADHATGAADAAPPACIGRDCAEAIMIHLTQLGIDWAEVRDSYGNGIGLADIAGFQALLDVKVTDLSPDQGMRLLAELKRRVAGRRAEKAAVKV